MGKKKVDRGGSGETGPLPPKKKKKNNWVAHEVATFPIGVLTNDHNSVTQNNLITLLLEVRSSKWSSQWNLLSMHS